MEKSTEGRSDDVTGAFVWFYVPKHGRFILLLGAHPELGFQKAGEIRGTSLAFKIGQDSYVLNAGARIAPPDSRHSIYTWFISRIGSQHILCRHNGIQHWSRRSV